MQSAAAIDIAIQAKCMEFHRGSPFETLKRFACLEARKMSRNRMACIPLRAQSRLKESDRGNEQRPGRLRKWIPLHRRKIYRSFHQRTSRCGRVTKGAQTAALRKRCEGRCAGLRAHKNSLADVSSTVLEVLFVYLHSENVAPPWLGMMRPKAPSADLETKLNLVTPRRRP